MSQRLSITVTFSDLSRWRTSVAAIIAYCGYVFRVILLASLTMPVEVAAAQKLLFDIPQSSANVALREYAIQADRQILIPHEVVKEYNANLVAGYYFADDALDILLENSGLEAVTNEAGILIIKENKVQVRGEETVMNKPKKGLLAALLGVFGAGTAAMAPGMATAQEGVSAIEEIIVTAQKREQNLQDVGISITALDAKGLAEAGIDDISRIYLVAPGVNYGFYGSDTKIAIRGAHSNNTYADNQSVAGFYIDGVYRARPSQQSQGYFDVERIEVLRGPQGTLYGRNTFAGAINLYTKKPSTEGLTSGIEVGIAEFGTFESEGHVNLPMGDTFAVRVAFMTKDSDGYIENLGTGGEVGGDETRDVRVSALWSPNEDLDVLARFTYIDAGGSVPGIFASEAICRPVNASGMTDAYGTIKACDNPIGGAILDNTSDVPWQRATNHVAIRDYREDNFTLDINYAINEELSARVILSYTDFVNFSADDGEVSEAFGFPFYFDEAMESLTSELNLTYVGEGPISGTAGVYYSKDEYDYGFSQENIGGSPMGFTADGISYIYADRQEIEIVTKAVFTQLEFAVTDSMRLIGGVRYNEEEKDALSYAFCSFAGNAFFPPSSDGTVPPRTIIGGVDVIPLNPGGDVVQEYDIVTWKVAAEWDMGDDAMVYAGVSTGYLSGGVNNSGSTFDEQESESYEVGLKSRFAEDTVQLNLAIYRQELTNLTTQIAFVNAAGAFITETVNGGSVTTNGAEVELTWLPTDQWTVNAGISIMDAEHKVFFINNGWQQAFGVTAPSPAENLIDLRGTAPPWSPDVTLSLSAGYDWDLGDMGTLRPFMQFYYSSDYNTDDLVTYFTQVQESYSKTDFRLFWSSADGRFGAQAYVENIEDEAVLARTNIDANQGVSSYLFPRTYGVKFSYFLN